MSTSRTPGSGSEAEDEAGDLPRADGSERRRREAAEQQGGEEDQAAAGVVRRVQVGLRPGRGHAAPGPHGLGRGQGQIRHPPHDDHDIAVTLHHHHRSAG